MSQDKRFLMTASVVKAKDLEVFADLASRLKRFGRVSVNVGQLAAKTPADIPPGGSPWHEYTAGLPVLTKKFFPHAVEQPFLDMASVRRNLTLMRACARVLRARKLDAWFATHDPFFMPEAFFVAHPHLRGARLDHPRRTRQEAFGICRDCDEGRAMLAWSTAQLLKAVPEITDLGWMTNDAGGGICWTEWLYPGPNGPDHCRHLNAGEHVANVLGGFDDGSGGKLDVVLLHGNFTQIERQLIPHYVDTDRVFWDDRVGREPRMVRIGSTIDNPVIGIFNPVAILAGLERASGDGVRKIMVNFSTGYRRGHELPEVAEKVIEIVEAYFKAPASGTIGRLTLLRDLCGRWAGRRRGDELLETLIELNEAYKYKQVALPSFSGNYVGVSMRHITRPLLALPEKLSLDEEAYFLPHLFNPNIREGRMDYLDLHGGRMAVGGATVASPNPRPLEVDPVCWRFLAVADRLAGLKGKGAAVFRDMAVSLRMGVSIIRSIGNFYGMQMVRDRNADRFAGEPTIPAKVASMTGDADLLLIHEYMRDELDNTAELLDLLENGGGMRRFLTARRPGDVEDTFMLGADITDQLRRKMAIMRDHWLDASAYLAPPHK